MTSIAQDLRLASRIITRKPLFTTIVVGTLAIAIGLNTAVFSAVDALLLRPLPGTRDPGALVQLYRSWSGFPGGGGSFGSNSLPHYRDLRDRSGDVFTDVALWSFNPVNVAPGGTPQRLMGNMVSANYFTVMGVTPERGRFFVPAEDTGQLAHRVAVISHATWMGLFGGDANVVGRHFIVNGQEYEVIGVAPDAFTGTIPIVRPAMWLPLTQLLELRPGSEGMSERRGNNSFSVVARLKPGVTAAAAQERMHRLAAELRAVYPDEYAKNDIAVVRQADAGIHPMFRSAEVGLMAVVLGVVVILLLIACVNVANLFLARARDRAREMAVRISLGAARRALVRQLLVESVAYAVIAAALGLALAAWVISLVNQIQLPFDIDFGANLTLSPLVLGLTAATSLVAAMVFGVVPALQATRPSLVPALKGEAPAGGSRSRMRSGLVVAQMAMSIVLLVAAGLFLRNLRAVTTVDKGFTAEQVLLAELDPGMQGYTRARTEAFYAQLREKLRANPSVQSLAFTEAMPLGLNESDTMVEVAGYVPAPTEIVNAQFTSVSEGYFDTMGIRVLRGRPILATDDSTSQRVLVVNQFFADKYLKGREAVGATVKVGTRDYTIVGVVPTGKYQRLGEDPTAFMYFSNHQRFNSGLTVVIATKGDPNALIPALRAIVTSLDPALPLANVQSLERHLGIALLPARLTGAVLGVFGALGLLLAAIGMYGVMAYSVSQRTREIGIRMAIGAATTDVVRLVMRQGMTLVAIGGVIGMAGAFAASRALGGVLYGGGENDLATFVAVPVTLALVALVATWIPARRAAGTDPLLALRQE